jgi:hypothetical protein
VIRLPDGESHDYDDVDFDDLGPIEKMRPFRDGIMPVGGEGATTRGRHRSKAGQRPRRRPHRPDGMHRRRVRKME